MWEIPSSPEWNAAKQRQIISYTSLRNSQILKTVFIAFYLQWPPDVSQEPLYAVTFTGDKLDPVSIAHISEQGLPVVIKL